MILGKPHSRYMHMYVIVRVDVGMGVEDASTCVSVWFTLSLANAEAHRLNQIARPSAFYRVDVTRLKEPIPVAAAGGFKSAE